jgi:hypothetical protein
MTPRDQPQKSEVHETTEDASSIIKTNPDSDTTRAQPGEPSRADDAAPSRNSSIEDVRVPPENLLGSEDDESDVGGPIDLDLPPA